MGRRTTTSIVKAIPWVVLLLFQGTYTQDTARCLIRCQANLDAVCGSDGKTYANSCVLRAEACLTRTAISEVSKGECPEAEKCDIKCSSEFMPVCGSNGKTYANGCVLEVEACQQEREITVVKEGECQTGECFNPVDLVFALDASGSIKTTGFQKIKDFTKELVGGFKIGVRHSHVGVIVFSHKAEVAVRLDETFDKATLLQRIQNVSYMGYTTATDDALRVSNEMFSLKGGARQNVPLLLIVLTDGNCTQCIEDVSIPARALRDKGVEIFSIAVGKKFDIKEILSFVSSPASDHIFQVDNLDRLKTLKDQLTYSGCQAKRGKCPALPLTVSCGDNVRNECVRDQSCGGIQKCCYDGCSRKCVYPLLKCQTPIEIAFALDSSSSIAPIAYKRMKEVVKKIVDSFSVSQSNTRFSVLLYSTSADLQFNLVRYDDATSVKNAIDNMPHLKSGTRIDKALREAKRLIFSLEGYVRQQRPMVLVVVTDGSTNRGSEDLSVASQPLKDFGVTVIAVGVGPEVNRFELQKFASVPTAENIITTKTFSELIPDLFGLTEKICREKPGTCSVVQKRSDCVDTIDECNKDFDCFGESKCCFDGCKKACKERLGVCRRKVDLTFVIDHSDSVGADNFRLVKRFVSRTMENFNVGADQTRVSVVCFGTQANVEWTFKDYPGQNMKAANDALTQIRFTGGASRLDLALDLANEGIYNTRNGMRQYAFKLMVIITDGGIGEISGMRQSIKALKDKGVNFLALGVGPLKEVKTLETITKYDNKNSRVFLVKRFDDMKQYAQDISDSACFAPATVPDPGETKVKGSGKKCGPPKCIRGPKGARGRYGRTGRQGPSGDDGPRGAPGPQGPKGLRGETGMQGPRGSRGGRGLHGMPGHPGMNGIPGVPGVEGRPGRPGQCGLKGGMGGLGPDGVNGLDGGPGKYGEQGTTGQKGEPAANLLNNIPLQKGFKGDIGEQGFEGPKGKIGEPGQSGSTGDKGGNGFEGPDGTKGEPGEPGKVHKQRKGVRGDTGDRGIAGKAGSIKDTVGNFSFLGPAGDQGQQGIRGDKGARGEANDTVGTKGVQGATGSQGEKGSSGEDGQKGEKGVRGFRGSIGSAGDAGTRGPKGKRGTDGRKGRVGYDGPPGPAGQPGEDADEARRGEKGVKGSQGETGDNGSRGITGAKGIVGSRGSLGYLIPGASGDAGEEGAPGPQGEPGNQGVGGMMGPMGPPGPEGDPGPVGDPGFTPKVVDGIDGMDGPPGKKGPPGAYGDPGTPGSRGPQTIVKTLCDEGVCPKGPKGEPGPLGPTGPPGDKGRDGDSGSKGFRDTCPTCPGGDQGSAGDYGLPGQVGPDGPPGPQGADGEKGEKGRKGAVGFKGGVGYKGSRGPPGGRGEPGLKGDMADQPISIPGDRGENGDRGSQGDAGLTGPPGLSGPPGFKGQRGFSGISPPRGERGVPGERGGDAQKGSKGEAGEIGEAVSGNTGVTGDEGEPGESGRQGVQGPFGPKGFPGSGPSREDLKKMSQEGLRGNPGDDGDPGENGAPGPIGDVGPAGAVGDDGDPTPKADAVLRGLENAPKGQRGERGPTGVTGGEGPSGLKGVQGARGPTGAAGLQGPKGSSACDGSAGSLESPKRDVAFLIDSSASLRQSDFMAQKNIVKQIIRDVYPVSVDGNRIGIIRYSDDAKVEVNLDEYFTNKALYNSIDTVAFTQGGSRIDKALKLARDQLFKPANGARSDAKKILILLTDGYQSTAEDMESPMDLASELKKQGTTIFVLGGGPEIDWNLLTQVASQERYMVEAKNFNDLFSSFQAVQSALKSECGTKGAKGGPGEVGLRGNAGNPGRRGRKGAKGVSFSGEIGQQGPQGSKGEAGQGIQGAPGPQGLMGFPGARGLQGDTGSAGRFGPKGAKGFPGSPATSAPTGKKGLAGVPGPKGISGQKLCREVLRTDLAFFLDASASLGEKNFNKTKRFVKTIANAFDVSPANTHVSVATYSSDVDIEFNFEKHTVKKDLFTAIDAIPYRSGRLTFIDSALLKANAEVFTPENKARSNALRALLILTDGQQSTRPRGEKPNDLAALAKKLRDRGIRVYVLGVGAEVDKLQLRSMVDVDHHLFLKQDFDQLNARIETELVELNDLGCSGQKGSRGGIGKKGEKGSMGRNGSTGPKGVRGELGLKGVFGEPGASAEFNSIGNKGEKGKLGVKGLPGLPGCNRETSTKEEVLDIAFMMDASGSLYGDNYSKEKKFVKQVIDNLNIGRGQTRVSVMTYSKNANVYVKFDQYFDKTALKSAVDGIPYEALNTRIDKALALAKTEMFSPANGARPYARRVAVLLTDGQQSVVPGSVDVAVAAKGLRDSDVEIFAVGIGPEIDLLQLNEMVSKPSFVFYASDFDRLLREISTEIALALRCTGGPPGPSGEKGDRGRIGPTGIAGVPGEKGRKGDVGSGGRTGLQGEDGPSGAVGRTGRKGSPGDFGDDGYSGQAGATGQSGKKGEIGTQGVDGDVGPVGGTGPKGFKGRKGVPGESPFVFGPGEKGVKGAKGERGVTGFPGFRGEESSLPDNIFEEAFGGQKGDNGEPGGRGLRGRDGVFHSSNLTSFKGRNGEKGSAGPSGLIGDKGATGEQGPLGDNGVEGVKGREGPRGPTGEVGKRGGRGAKGEEGSRVKGPPGDRGFLGFPGLVGEKGNKGRQGFMGLNGDKGVVGERGPKGRASPPGAGLKGFKGMQGDPGPSGATGPKGEEGDQISGERGAPGEEGPFGVKGEIGIRGPRGPKGSKGITGFAGLQGLHGEDGSPGSVGLQGIKGDMGEVIFDSTNNRGDSGDFGAPGPQGYQGSSGPRGLEGPRGSVGIKGERGDQGKNGMPGLPGDIGPDGYRGPRGDEGLVGNRGEDGDQGPAGPVTPPDGFYIVRHSQTDVVPACPKGHKTLWTGYSWLYSVGNGMAHGQDLANAGSCVKSFSSMPFVHCEVSKNCRYASRNDFMYWLSALKDGKSMSPVSVLAVAPFISRCSVCETQAMHVAMHSQDTSIPDCPLGWSSMWSGYSFMMMTGSSGTGTGESLASSGSCLENFRVNPFIECNGGRGSCNFFTDKLSFWMMTVNKQTMFEPVPEALFDKEKGDNLKARVSRCRVCTKGFASNSLEGPRDREPDYIPA